MNFLFGTVSDGSWRRGRRVVALPALKLSVEYLILLTLAVSS